MSEKILTEQEKALDSVSHDSVQYQEGNAQKRPRKRIKRIRPLNSESVLSVPSDSYDSSSYDAGIARSPEEGTSKDAVATGVLWQDKRTNIFYIRSAEDSYKANHECVYVPNDVLVSLSLREGDTITYGFELDAHSGRKKLKSVESVNFADPQLLRHRADIEKLVPVYPTEKFNIAYNTSDVSLRLIDIFAPIGKGQRALIVAQPKTGKTILLQKIANAIIRNHHEAYVIVLLVDERPEEVTDFARNVPAEVVAATFDESPKRQIELSEIVIEKARRLAEMKWDVVILLDSITRLARAYNAAMPNSGKILTGGMDASAFSKPKRFIGSARNLEGAGSITIIATALVDTGSKMDEVIFEELKGRGNAEIVLSRQLANKRIYPAINILETGTRREELLMPPDQLEAVSEIRKFMADMKPLEAAEFVIERIKHTRNNEEFFSLMKKWISS